MVRWWQDTPIGLLAPHPRPAGDIHRVRAGGIGEELEVIHELRASAKADVTKAEMELYNARQRLIQLDANEAVLRRYGFSVHDEECMSVCCAICRLPPKRCQQCQVINWTCEADSAGGNSGKLLTQSAKEETEPLHTALALKPSLKPPTKGCPRAAAEL